MTVSSSSKTEQLLSDLGDKLTKQAMENPDPDAETCLDLLKALDKESPSITLAILEKVKIGKAMVRARRSFQRLKSKDDSWEPVVKELNNLIQSWKKIADDEEAAQKKKKKQQVAEGSKRSGPPKNAAEYRMRLVSQNKDLYKDPPVLPPKSITVESERAPPPKRDKETGALSFTSTNAKVKSMLKDFHPNRTPEEVLRAGSFGGTYFRSIVSAVTNQSYKAEEVLRDTVPDKWIKDIPSNWLTSQSYKPAINKYGVKCGGSLGMWESSGWIVDVDPYGWFQWYCRFYQGRRCSDDERQISRWLKSAGPKGRFVSILPRRILIQEQNAFCCFSCIRSFLFTGSSVRNFATKSLLPVQVTTINRSALSFDRLSCIGD